MKRYEERTTSSKIARNEPFIIRLDGHKFSTFTRPFQKPFDERCMWERRERGGGRERERRGRKKGRRREREGEGVNSCISCSSNVESGGTTSFALQCYLRVHLQ